jgi:DNA-binding transcriptional MerR regulator
MQNIRDLIRLNNHPEEPCDDAHQIATRHLDAVKSRIAKLQRLEKELMRITAIPDCGRAGGCNVIKSLVDHRLCESEH